MARRRRRGQFMAQPQGQTAGQPIGQPMGQPQGMGQSMAQQQGQPMGQPQSMGQLTGQRQGMGQSMAQQQMQPVGQGQGMRQAMGQPMGQTMAQPYASRGMTGADTRYQNAEEPTHNGNFAWNGQPIPNNWTAGAGMPSAAPQNRGGMPVPGSSGNPNAPYGQRNTGINNADARNVGYQGGYTGYGANGLPAQFGTFMRDGTQYGAGPHTIDPRKAIVTGVRYANGGISAVRFQDGSVANIAQAIGMAESGLIEDVNTGRNREGQKTLRSYPDGYEGNNLSNLPRF